VGFNPSWSLLEEFSKERKGEVVNEGRKVIAMMSHI
jgi:hypothetical protein